MILYSTRRVIPAGILTGPTRRTGIPAVYPGIFLDGWSSIVSFYSGNVYDTSLRWTVCVAFLPSQSLSLHDEESVRVLGVLNLDR